MRFCWFLVYQIGWIWIAHRDQALDMWLIGWDNYFITQFLSLKDQRRKGKEKENH
jgi:hypothetical protein